MSKSTLTRRNFVAVATTMPIVAVATPSLALAAPDGLDRAAIVARAEQVVEVLRTSYVAEGWQFDEPRAAGFLDSLRRLDFYAGGTEQTVVLDWIKHHGQSLDWILDGDPGGMICTSAAQSDAALQSDVELLRLGVEVEKFGQEWLVHCELDEQNSKEFDARCEAARLPQVGFESMPLEAWHAYQNKRLAAGRLPDPLPDSTDFWDDFWDRFYALRDEALTHKPQTFAGLTVLAHATALTYSNWWDGDDDDSLSRTFLETFCKIAGIVPAPIQKAMEG